MLSPENDPMRFYEAIAEEARSCAPVSTQLNELLADFRTLLVAWNDIKGAQGAGDASYCADIRASMAGLEQEILALLAAKK
ncbi:hypothetical protein [Shimia abyssi]|uniref:Uncharacterized protein n=1 Tax=Shimia abyssi TaxID=1662395 RepID=A0A2P8FCB9_9RHOB|nr:hypothetical protein [Shimia abyssi]PSL19322.1 hypothetical protein CLV88_10634 [Shimia abyssi]